MPGLGQPEMMLLAGAAVVLVAGVCAVAFAWSGLQGVLAALWRLSVIAVGALAAWVLFDRVAVSDRLAARRALDQRFAELTRQAVAPGSPLACLDGFIGETIESACEKSVFASAETVAAAIAYTSARLSLFADGVEFANRVDPSYESTLAPTRMALESDRFGFVAQVLALRDSCTAQQCDQLAALRDPSRVQANLKERTFDAHVGRYAEEWAARAARPNVPVADDAPPSGAGPTLASSPSATGTAPPVATPLSSRYDFPSAASIPPVSIMTSEPGTPSSAVPPSASPAAATPVPRRRPQQAKSPLTHAPANRAQPESAPPVPPPAAAQSSR